MSSIKTDRLYIAEMQKFKRLSKWEKLFMRECVEKLDEDIPLSSGQREKMQQIILKRGT